ncbi:MAG TPA: hypothetical protein VF463_10665 [Sphingobium sp.]
MSRPSNKFVAILTAPDFDWIEAAAWIASLILFFFILGLGADALGGHQ